jgi:hypothetical protein
VTSSRLEFGFGEVELAAVFWRIMPFEPLSEPARRGGRKSRPTRLAALDRALCPRALKRNVKY